MSSNINDFIASFKGGARANRFRIGITWPGLVGTPNVTDEIIVHAGSMPESQLGVVQVPYKGRQIPVPGDRTFAAWTITCLNDTTFSHRNSFERWSNLILSHESNVQSTSSYRDYVCTIDVVQLDRDDTILKSIKLLNAFPTNISQVDLGYNNNDTIEEYTVTFDYTHWTSDNSPTS